MGFTSVVPPHPQKYIVISLCDYHKLVRLFSTQVHGGATHARMEHPARARRPRSHPLAQLSCPGQYLAFHNGRGLFHTHVTVHEWERHCYLPLYDVSVESFSSK